MKLIGSTASPFVRKVRVVMAEKKLDYQFVLEDVWSDKTQINQHNPLGKVPCLVIEGVEAMYDSRVIVDYLDTLSPVGKLIPPVGRERAAVKTLEALADGLLDAAILARMEATWAGRTKAQRSQAWIERQMGKVDESLKVLAMHLGEQPYFTGIHMGLADIAVGCALGWLEFRFPDLQWRDQHPNLGRLLDKLMQRPSFAETVPFA
ncbi:glutathione S-transferase N-terminal domain-containing protein [Curvibacter sp. CHRR-16]|uniref:glutathione S-transferase N-terminal domain-containing protein n=1 Tax=Curvibacter sp. CHRR-16 TaxID=2835872 RepID=UPI001BDA85AE|nr:glutathione S-transferase N-terminal domain-containing protein [Curvibacter sp. CHRR-16]MBT0570424.1 glutathione S-transferase N-terminal domain-containing protein [Curvibacter sp. CHRR-16]